MEEEVGFLKQWLLDLPRVKSHYCWKSDVYKNKRFLFPGTKVSDVHGDNAETREWKQQVSPFSEKLWDFQSSYPKKTSVKKCIQSTLEYFDEEEFKSHICDKNKAREEKGRDKLHWAKDTSVWTLDLQSVLWSSQSNVSCMYYKTKVQLHNMTYFNLHIKNGFCYVWDETDGTWVVKYLRTSIIITYNST